MFDTTRTLIDALGGYRKVAARGGWKPTTVHTHMVKGTLPAKMFRVFCEMCEEDGFPAPPAGLFNFDEKPGGSVGVPDPEAAA
jgi:hypothetical protein